MIDSKLVLKESASTVQFYSTHVMDLKFSQKHKIQKFLEHNCIQYAGNGEFVCLPLEGYNKTTYSLKKNSLGEFECNCQGFQKKLRETLVGSCSHVGALYEAFKQKKFGGGQSNLSGGLVDGE